MIHSKVMTQLMSNNGCKCLHRDLPKLPKHRKVFVRFLNKKDMLFVSQITFSQKEIHHYNIDSLRDKASIQHQCVDIAV